jgi:hypothetical protein
MLDLRENVPQQYDYEAVEELSDAPCKYFRLRKVS